MRAGIVREGRPHMFFVTRRGAERVLAGYYEIGWSARAKPIPAAWTGKKFLDDFALAAIRVHFLAEPIPLSHVASRVGDPGVNGWFRLNKKVEGATCRRILSLMGRLPDATPNFVSEIHRLERINHRFTGFRYVNWREESEFSWEKAVDFLADANTHLVLEAVGKLQGRKVDHWTCVKCGGMTFSKSPLRRCAQCKAVGTQIPEG
jgi:hypothetical protein